MRRKYKIMILNIVFHDNNTCNVTFLVNLKLKLDSFKGYILLNLDIDSNLFYNFNRYGKWINNKYFSLNKYFYVYISPNNKIIFKNIRFNNFLNIGDFNCYDHKLIYKSSIK